ncbi:hypothetical protein JCM18750_12780 [Halostagnicola bangensis]
MLSYIPILLFLFALAAFYEGIQSYRRARRVSAVLSGTAEQRPNETTTVKGPVSITEPVTVEHEPPAEAAHEITRPALVAWRVRKRVGGGKHSTSRWKTVEGALEAGNFEIREDGRYVRVPDDELATDPNDVVDPFGASSYHLGDPQIEVRLGEPDRITKFLEHIRLIGEDSLLSGVGVSLSVGSRTTTPDEYQALCISEGDEIAVSGKLMEGERDPVLRTSDESSIIAGDNVARRAKKWRYRALSQVGLGVVSIGCAEVLSNVL